MEINVNNKCRACLSENDAMLSLFEVYEHDLTLAMILQSCIATEVYEDDGLPSHLCDSCILVLTQFYNFTVVYEESDRQLRSLLRKNRRVITIDNVAEYENVGEEQAEIIETGTSEADQEQLQQSDILNEIVAVEVSQDDVISNCGSSGTYQLYELKVNDNSEDQEEVSNLADYEIHHIETLQEFKEEVILPEETEMENVNGEVEEYVELHLTDKSADLVKEELQLPQIEKKDTLYEEIVKYECTACGEAHLYANSFQQHMRIKHHIPDVNCDDYASRIQIKVYQKVEPTCSLPPLSQEEMKILNGEPRHKCQFCSKQFHFASQLQQHAKWHDANKKYVCDVCGARFIRKTYLDDHMEGHSTEKKHVCKFCGKAFRRRTVLRAHKRVHTHPNHYVCELCGRAFTNSSTLKTHRLLIHIRERNFRCVICNLTFPLKSTLNKHVLRHQKRENGEKGFNCTLCEMQYRDKSSLKRHMETKHQGRVQLISCTDCPKMYTSKANLMKHRRRHHNIIIT